MESDSSPITLNVGGTLFQTTLSTLRKHKGSKLDKLFEKTDSIPKDDKGNFFLDRDPEFFKHIISFNRSNKIAYSPDDSINDMILLEFQHWEIPLPNDQGWKFYSKTENGNTIHILTRPIRLYGEALVEFTGQDLFMRYDGKDSWIKGPINEKNCVIKFDARDQKVYVGESKFNVVTPSLELVATGRVKPWVRYDGKEI
mmetsp:Transcript_39893/g.35590  ORF Transcript_39893/g.35590 Transcript_39893/m.35590 type:complete len:199 (-) Transcript_39893:154-750(-)